MSLIFSHNKFDTKCWFLRCYIWYPCVHTELIWVLCVLKEYSLSLVLPSLEYLQEYFGGWFNPRNIWVFIKIYWMDKKINKFGLITSALKRVENQEWEYNHTFFVIFFLKLYQRSENAVVHSVIIIVWVYFQHLRTTSWNTLCGILFLQLKFWR